MAAVNDGEDAFGEGNGKTSELAVQAVYKGTAAQGGWNGGKGPVGTSTAARRKRERIALERDSCSKQVARKEEKGKRKVAKVTPEFGGALGKQDTLRQIAP